MKFSIEKLGSTKNSGQTESIPEDMFVDGVPERKQRAIRGAARAFTNLLQEKEGITLTPEDAETIERFFLVANAIDFLIDEKKIPIPEMTAVMSGGNSSIPSLGKALARIQSLVEKHGDYQEYLSAATRALSYSGKDSIQDRHREALYIGKALASAIRRDEADKEHLEEICKKVASIANFVDDVMDYETDGKSESWMRERRGAAMRALRKFYEVSDSPHSYWLVSAALIFTMHTRKLLPDSLNLFGLK